MKKLFVLVFMLSAGFVQAQDVFKKQLFSADLILKYRQDIALSEQQTESVKKAYNNHITKYNSLKWELDAQLVKMDKLMSGNKVNDEAALKSMDDLLDLENELKKQRFELLLQLKNLLTEVQQEKLRELKSDDDGSGFDMITPINENPRVLIKVDGPESAGEPLYFIKDKRGKRRVSSLSDLKPEDIESIEVIKGEKALDAYGQEGKNGVILVTLKKQL